MIKYNIQTHAGK